MTLSEAPRSHSPSTLRCSPSIVASSPSSFCTGAGATSSSLDCTTACVVVDSSYYSLPMSRTGYKCNRRQLGSVSTQQWSLVATGLRTFTYCSWREWQTNGHTMPNDAGIKVLSYCQIYLVSHTPTPTKPHCFTQVHVSAHVTSSRIACHRVSMFCDRPSMESVRHPTRLLKHTPTVTTPVAISPAYTSASQFPCASCAGNAWKD